MENQKLTRQFFIILYVAVLFAAFFAIIVYRELAPCPVSVLIQQTFIEFILASAGGIIFSICYYLIRMLYRFMDKDVASTRMQLLILRLCETLRTKNSNVIGTYLQYFLFHVLKNNNEHLHLPLGSDVTSLTPCGASYTYHNGCVFYRYQIILPELLDTPYDELRQLMQGYVAAELLNYGIAGLNSRYTDRHSATCDSVYIDRIFADEDNKMLFIDVLYVSSQTSADYLKAAIQRDKPHPIREPEVYDDELA